MPQWLIAASSLESGLTYTNSGDSSVEENPTGIRELLVGLGGVGQGRQPGELGGASVGRAARLAWRKWRWRYPAASRRFRLGLCAASVTRCPALMMCRTGYSQRSYTSPPVGLQCMRHVLIGVDTTTDTWGFSIVGGALLELAPAGDTEHGAAIAAVRLVNTCTLSKRKLRKHMIWDVGRHARRGVVMEPSGWIELAQDTVSSAGDALALFARAQTAATSRGLQRC